MPQLSILFALSLKLTGRLFVLALKKQKAARSNPEKPGSFVITDVEKAKSQNILPFILDRYGKAGWKLQAVNKMECFIFGRTSSNHRFSYKVLTPADIDKMSVSLLQSQGAAELVVNEANQTTLQVTNPGKAKVQIILPKILDQLAVEGWSLTAITGPQLYIFTRLQAR